MKNFWQTLCDIGNLKPTLKYLSKKYNLELIAENRLFSIEWDNSFVSGVINGHEVVMMQKYIDTYSNDGGTMVKAYTFVDIKLAPYFPNVIIRRKGLYFNAKNHLLLKSLVEDKKRIKVNELVIITDEENIPFYNQIVEKFYPNISSLLGGKLAYGAIVIDSNVLRFVKQPHILSSVNLSKGNAEKLLLGMTEWASILENNVTLKTEDHGVENFIGSEHNHLYQLSSLLSIEKVLDRYNKLISDNLTNTNVEIINYRF